MDGSIDYMKQKEFFPWRPVHVCQKGVGGQLLFYCLQDRLVYYTVFCTEARKYGIKTLALCLMYNHVHAFIQIKSKEVMSNFNKTVQMIYAREFSKASSIPGQVFLHSFVWAHKSTDKEVRNCLAYIANNPVEKQLVNNVLDYQWNFVRYALSDHPFSPSIKLRNASRRLRRSVARVRTFHQYDRFLSHAMLDELFAGLSTMEQRQLSDFIISQYSAIDHKAAAQYWGGIERMAASYQIVSGSEYDISEEKEDDIPYRNMLREVRRRGYKGTEYQYLRESGNTFQQWFFDLQCIAPRWQVLRFLHLRPIPSRDPLELRPSGLIFT